ncbi:molybdate ABC transporter substrate-binding protein [Sulfitobacter sp. F26204]|uniref:molybdate ABC transporter substrate-binding protein n=1 Tax=Sulfitobacter sp. F26204 TaxID=2996014 RepID=UPI00225E2840|nr:molybdate ABC transporter substrate-binding protein [Sulfitobacter sp. F26204]MCX7561186.1 molybdate ABC transporter substrate-binding protein [Sulfitobacter sp. F26204]
MTRIAFFLITVLGFLVPTAGKAEQITIFAAASLRGALQEIGDASGHNISHSFGGSGTMARQVAAGAPADVVILANKAWMDWLTAQEITGLSSPTKVAANRLVLIGPKGAAPLAAPSEIPTRLGTGRLAMGQRDAVPAGTYTRQWLVTAGLWGLLQRSLAETDNVRAALALVARGDVALGVVYATDARAEPMVDIVFHVPPETHAPIGYFAASLTPAGAVYLSELNAPAAQAIFGKHGFGQVVQ